MISQKEVRHVAQLARLGLTEKEIGKLQKDLSAVLNYVEKLKKADVSKIVSTSHPLKVENVVRPDQENSAKQSSGKLLDLAPEIKEGYIKVKSIF